MAKADIQEVFEIDRDTLFDVITRYEDYPQFVEGCTGVKVERKASGACRATYAISMMKDFSYTLDHRENRESGKIEWTLVSSDFFRANTGAWTLRAVGPGRTEVRYSIDLDFKVPVPGFILKKLVQGNLPGMMKSFRERALKKSH
jgi:ribosome-associated toxin RatA of RatAB toxin-antitoxin module